MFTLLFANSAVCLHFSSQIQLFIYNSCKNFLLDGLNRLNGKTLFLIFAKVCWTGKKKAEERCFNKIFFYRSTCRFLCPKPILKRKMLIQSLRLMRSMRSTKNKYQKKAPQNCCFLKWFIAKVKALKDMIALFGLKASKGLLR